MSRLSEGCRELFYGSTDRSLQIRFLLLGFDFFVLSYFIVSTFMPLTLWIIVIDAVIGVILLGEFAGRVVADRDRTGLLSKPLAILDILIIVSLFIPAVLGNFAFLRVIRSLRVLHSYIVLRELRAHSNFLRRNQEVIFSALNLMAFVFVVTALVFVLQHDVNPAINNYVDALYFTITTMTTTGFGDITLTGNVGRMLAVLIMIVGVALFIRLAQAVFRPSKVRYECPGCGLVRHEIDAVHCKHCGRELHIKTEGQG